LQQTDIPIRDGVDLLGAELAYLLAAKELAAAAGATGSAGTSSGATAGTATGTTWCRATLGCRCGYLGRFYLILI
jgi:hypothetical protein